MARPLKNGVDYFPLDVHLDDKFELIEAEFGLTGFAVVVKLFQKIYGGQGYYCEWTKDVALLFGKKLGFKPGDNAVSEIVRASIIRGIFDKDLYEKYHILTSQGIQNRYFEAVSRRKKIEIEKRYLLVPYAQIPENVTINEINVNGNSKKADDNTQSKVNKSKVKESKVKESKVKESKVNILHGADKSDSMQGQSEKKIVISLPLNDKSLFDIYPENIEHLAELYPAADVMLELRKMLGWLEANPNRRKTRGGINRFITNWLSKVQDKGGYNNNSGSYNNNSGFSWIDIANED